MSLDENLSSEIQKLDPSSMIELFELDCTDIGGDVFRFHNGTNKLSQNLVWQGVEYIRFPIEVTGFEVSGQGQFPRPTVKVSNALSAITSVILQLNDLLNAKFTRKRTLMKYLDAVNFPGSVNPDADPTVHFPDDIYWVDRKSSEDRDFVQFELSSAADLQSVQIPQRVVTQSSCPWVYRSAECSYPGIPLYDENDETIPLPPASALAQAMMAAKAAVDAAQVSLAAAQVALSAAYNAMITAQTYITSEVYSRIAPVSYVVNHPIFGISAYYGGVAVGLGSSYMPGKLASAETSGYFTIYYYYIVPHIRDEADVLVKEAAYAAALSTRNTALVTLSTAVSSFNAALAAMSPDDQMFKQDRCGKRLSSCKLRFGANNPLPFGGFPGVSR